MKRSLALFRQGVRRQTFMPFRGLALRAVWAPCLLLALGVAPAAAETLRGVVIVVIDGDTVLFKPEHYSPKSRAFLKIRLADIDAPEKDQPYGEAATRALKALALNQRVEVDTVATDAYGRKIARIRKGALQVDSELVRRGYAWAYGSIPRRGTPASSAPESSRASMRAALLDAQHAARRARRGLWQDPAPTPPWVWRRQQPARHR